MHLGASFRSDLFHNLVPVARRKQSSSIAIEVTFDPPQITER